MLGQGLNSLIPNSGSQNGDGRDARPAENDEKLLSTSEHAAPILIPVHADLQDADQEPNIPRENPIPPPLNIHPSADFGNGQKSNPAQDAVSTPTFPALARQPKSEIAGNSYQTKVLEDQDKGTAQRKSGGPPTSGAVFLIDVDKIIPNPHQPRKSFTEGGLKELTSSVRQYGILQPIIVAKVEIEVPGGTEVTYQLIAGERRLMAAKQAGLERVPAIIRKLDETHEGLELAILENLQREDLNPIEMARAFARLQDEFRFTQREIASRLGKSRETIANTLRLLDLPMSMQDAIVKGRISESHGRLLLTVKEPALQERLFQDLLDSNMTTRELHKRAKGGGSEADSAPEGIRIEMKLSPDLIMLQEKLSSTLGTPVTINKAGPGGKITINFYSEEELKSIVGHLKKLAED